MKRTLDVNLNNISFHLDDDAYEMLRDYLNEIETYLSEDERKDVMADIEARVAELFNEKLQKQAKKVINLEDVEEIITVLGKPNQYADEDSDVSDSSSRTSSSGRSYSKNAYDRKKNRKFYRDPEKAVIGGVAAGTAAFLGWDVVWVRLLFVVAFFISSGTMLLAYLLLWFIVPAAYSVSQRLEMQGENVTADKIKEEFNNAKNYMESDKFRSRANDVGGRLGNAIKSILKFIVIILGAVIGFVGLILLEVLILALIVGAFIPGFTFALFPEVMSHVGMFSPEYTIMLIISILLIVGCPIIMVIYWAIRSFSRNKSTSRSLLWVVLILWVAGMVMFASFSNKAFGELKNWGDFDTNEMNIHFGKSDQFEDDETVDEVRAVGEFYGVSAQGNIKVILIQGNTPNLIIRSKSGMMEKIKTDVKDHILKISMNEIYMNEKVQVTITNPSIMNVKLKGACQLNSDSLESEKLDIEVYGASKTDLKKLKVGNLKMDLQGASKADLNGTVDNLNAKIEGVSDVDANNLKSRVAHIQLDGASKARFQVTDSLWIEAKGASKVNVRKKPHFVKQESFGASSIKFD